jgi:hypothetical protein
MVGRSPHGDSREMPCLLACSRAPARTGPGTSVRRAGAAFAAAIVVAMSSPACGGSSSAITPAVDASTKPFDGVSADDAAIGNPAFSMGSPDGGGPLQVHIQVNGGGATCGACAIVLAQVQGGVEPYTYAWSDPSWQGPGPFQLCPDKATPVSLAVTDSSATSGEVATADQSVKAATSVDCVASDGSAPPGDLNGCTAGAAAGTPEAGSSDAGTTECTANEVEAGVAWADGGAVASESTLLPYTLHAGHTYSVSYDRLLPIVLGQPVTVELYGATEPDVCKADQKLFTLNLDGSIFNWHQSYCFTPDQDYHYVITNVYVQGVLFFFNALSVSTLCDTCSM